MDSLEFPIYRPDFLPHLGSCPGPVLSNQLCHGGAKDFAFTLLYGILEGQALTSTKHEKCSALRLFVNE